MFTKKNRKILYIAGLGHSGSTILDLSLGCNPKMIGLGEMTNLIRAGKKKFHVEEFKRILCSCGHDMSDCDFWFPAIEMLSKYSAKETSDRCAGLVDLFFQKYGEDKILVDSSKRIDNYLYELNKTCNLYVLFLVRDYRSWIYSRHSRHGTNILNLAYKWFKGNLKIKETLRNSKFNFITVGYEELALYPELILQKICNFLGVAYDPLMLIPDESKSHIIRGNVARGDKEKRKGFFYDARWLSSSKISFYGPLFLPLIHWNNKNVYQNIVIGNTKAFGVSQKDFVLFGDQKKEEMLYKLKEK